MPPPRASHYLSSVDLHKITTCTGRGHSVAAAFYRPHSLFNLYMNHLANISPGVNRICIALYADDILLIASSVTMFENLLNNCGTELNWLDMAINIKKSSVACGSVLVQMLYVVI